MWDCMHKALWCQAVSVNRAGLSPADVTTIPGKRVAWISGQRLEKQKHGSAFDVRV
jgi:hypothetical protein